MLGKITEKGITIEIIRIGGLVFLRVISNFGTDVRYYNATKATLINILCKATNSGTNFEFSIRNVKSLHGGESLMREIGLLGKLLEPYLLTAETEEKLVIDIITPKLKTIVTPIITFDAGKLKAAGGKRHENVLQII